MIALDTASKDAPGFLRRAAPSIDTSFIMGAVPVVWQGRSDGFRVSWPSSPRNP